MLNIKFVAQANCPVCQLHARHLISLPNYPITELYVDWTPEFVKDGFLDQSLYFCEKCDHAFLEKILDVRFIYQNYITTSGASQGALDCLINFKKFIERYVRINDHEMLIDIGGNDSTFLSYFKESDLRLINIDPNATGCERYELSRCFLEEANLACYKSVKNKIIVSSHTLEHLEQPAELIKNISESLTDSDYCFLQFPSIERLVENLRFDQICHQHINYFSLRSITKLLNSYGLHIIAYEYDDTHFGTLRVAVSANNSSTVELSFPYLPSSTVLNKHKLFRQYYVGLNESIEPVFERGTGFGAGLMVPTLAYYLPVINSLKQIVDENVSKHGKQFVNLAPKIVPIAQLALTDSVLITSISTKSAARAIFNKLAVHGVKNIVLPVILA